MQELQNEAQNGFVIFANTRNAKRGMNKALGIENFAGLQMPCDCKKKKIITLAE
jgi:hypothetical protein